MKTLKFLSAAAAAALVAVSCGGNQPALTVTNEDGTTKTVELPGKSLTDSVSYLVGLNFGYFIKANNFGEDLNYSQIKKGMMDFITADGNMNDPEFNEQFAISPDMMNTLFNKFITARHNYEAETNKQEGQAFLEKNKLNAGVVVTESGLQYKIVADGNEVKPGPQDTVYVHYKGTLIDGTEFDASDPEKDPVRMIMNRVIKGWTEGLQLIGEGGEIDLYIPAELAYGERGQGAIRPNSTLVFNVKLDKVNKFVPKEDKKDDKKSR